MVEETFGFIKYGDWYLSTMTVLKVPTDLVTSKDLALKISKEDFERFNEGYSHLHFQFEELTINN